MVFSPRVIVPALLVCCCGEGTTDTAAPTEPRDAAVLADMAAWVWSDSDPEPGHDPGSGPCAASSYGLEGSVLEVDTGLCPYAVLEQPLLADLRQGELIELVWWHNQLVAEEEAVGHVLLVADGVVLYEREVPIPSEPLAYTEVVEVAADVPEGAALVLHLHNHGANAWSFLRIERLAPTR